MGINKERRVKKKSSPKPGYECAQRRRESECVKVLSQRLQSFTLMTALMYLFITERSQPEALAENVGLDLEGVLRTSLE
jgi:hypothetical protein